MAKLEEIYSVEATVLRHTEKAVQIEVDGEEFWLPRSQLFDDDELPETGSVRIKMASWIAKAKGLI